MYQYKESEHYAAGVEHFDKSDWDEAIKYFSLVIEEFGEDIPELFLRRGISYSEKGWFDEAVEDFRWAISLGADDAETLGLLAEAYRGKGWFDEAIHFWGAALERDRDSAKAFYFRGLAYFGKGWFNEAIEHFIAAANLAPQDHRIPYSTAVALKSRGQEDEAERFVKLAVELGGSGIREYYDKVCRVELPSELRVPGLEARKTGAGKTAAGKPSSKIAAKKPAAKKKTGSKRPAAGKTSVKKTGTKKVKKSTSKKTGSGKASSRTKKSSGASMLDAAFSILEETGKAMHYKEITRAALKRKLIRTTGATPEQSMRSAISREISSKGARARFRRDDAGKGFYSLTYWDKE